MRKTKEQKAITLIALIITIVVLLILAAVAIASITNDGVLSYAENAATQYNQAVKNEQDTLQGYVDYLNKHNGGSTGGTGSGEGSGSEGEGTGTTKTVAEIKNEIQTSNTKVFDEFGNQIVVPAGFMIRVDEGTERTKGSATSFATHVTEGLVIEDESGNQFVWVPVGTIYTNVEKTESKTITLGRYSNFTATDGVYTPTQRADDYATKVTIDSYCFTEDTTSNHSKDNAIARNIGDFVNSSIQNGGYYIGRFEAGKENDKLVCKAGQEVYGTMTQLDASTLSKNMYNDGYAAGTFSSDLINSYAWDTAIIFIQTFEGVSYYYNNNCTNFTATGGNQDEYCNINDMSGNSLEWSTETCDYSNLYPCVYRGGCFGPYFVTENGYTSFRNVSATGASSLSSFRPLLYVAL